MKKFNEMLKYEKMRIITVQDWDKLVQETYGKPYSFQQQDDCKGRGTEYITVPVEGPYDYKKTEIPFKINGEIMGVSFETWLNTSVEEINKHFNPAYKWESELFWDRNFYPHVDMIINDLYSKGLIEAGKYGIVIDW